MSAETRDIVAQSGTAATSSVEAQQRARAMAEANAKIEQVKRARQLLVEAKQIMDRIDGPIAAELHVVRTKLDRGLADALLARELNS